MRALEITLAIHLFTRIILPLFAKRRLVVGASIAGLLVMILHLLAEGYRWQMTPLYGLTITYGLLALSQKREQKSDNDKQSRKRIALASVGVITLGIAVMPAILLPVPRTPKPTGTFDVGTITFSLVDSSREELYGPETGSPRTISVKIWYPIDKGVDGEIAHWLENMDVMGPALAEKLNLPLFFLEHIKYSQSYAVIDAPISNSQSKYPLLLFSHGWGGFKSQNTYQMEQLASSGFIVIAPDHTYGAMATILPDGSVALNNPDALPHGSNLSDDEFVSAVHQLGDQWSGDLSFILDYLIQPGVDNPIKLLEDRLDYSRIGVLGHSTGGGAAIQFCANDTRCQAALGMDPYMDPVSFQIQEQGLSKPYLAMFSESWAKESGRNNSIFNRFYENSTEDRYRYYLEDTKHYDFTDLPAFSPLAPYLGLKGTLDGKQVMKIINAYSLAFFGKYLVEDGGTLLDEPSAEYPEIKILH